MIRGLTFWPVVLPAEGKASVMAARSKTIMLELRATFGRPFLLTVFVRDHLIFSTAELVMLRNVRRRTP
jgi:hypothetical protein